MQVQEVLSRLDAECVNSDDVAALLAKEGVKGFQGDADCCPIANYLKKTSGVSNLSVTCKDVSVYKAGLLVESVPTPTVVDEFICDFDGGSFPELEEEDEFASDDY